MKSSTLADSVPRPTRPARLPDSTGAIVAAILLGVIGPAVIVMMPGIVQGFVDHAGLSERQAGFAASVEVAGILAGTTGFAIFGDRIRWTRACQLALLTIVAANLGSIGVTRFPALCAIRFLAGLGSGVIIAASFAALGLTRRPDRWFGLLIAGVLAYAAAGLWFMPALYRIGGLSALMIAFALAGALGLSVAHQLPNGRGAATVSAARVGRGLTASAMGSLALFVLGYGVIWTYMALIGHENALDDQEIAHALTVSQFFGVAGAMAVVLLANRIAGRSARIIMIGGVAGAGALGTAAFTLPQSPDLFLVLNGLFQFTWNAGQPAILGAIAVADRSGRLLMIAVPMQFVGSAIGPALAALLLAAGYMPVILVSAALIGVGFVVALPMLLDARMADRVEVPACTN